jgi:hypothetical protein
MKKISQIGAALTVVALLTLTWMNANANVAASCAKGKTKICFKVTAGGSTEYYCNETAGSVKDCS